MYKQFYGFSQDPFSINPDPRFLYMTPTHFEAYSSMLSGISERKGLIVITGEAGSGKTIVIHALLNELRGSVKTAFIYHPRLGVREMLKEVLLQLDAPIIAEQTDLAYLINQFRIYLLERAQRDESVAVVIDEAQEVDEEALLGLWRFCELEGPSGKVLQVLLVGHPELEAKLGGEKLGLTKHIEVSRRLKPLDKDECRRYIEHRMKVGGREDGLFTLGAADRIRDFAGGIPRVINQVCERALMIGLKVSSPAIDADIAAVAAKELSFLRPPKPRALSLGKTGSKAFRIFCLTAAILLFAFSLQKLVSVILEK